MDWLTRMNRAMDYIEANLDGEIDLAEVARHAACSAYHFTRMFSFITGVPLNEYIRRRRLTAAGFSLKNSDVKVIDLAVKLGYDSPGAFTRAFVALNGVTPTEARRADTAIKAYPRLSFHITIKGDVEMDYRIEEKAAFRMFGAALNTTVKDGACWRDIPDFILRCLNDGTAKEIQLAAGLPEDALLGSAVYDHRPDGSIKYLFGTDAAGDGAGRFTKLDVPAYTWAVFPTGEHGVEETNRLVQDIWKRIYPEWFPGSGYEHAGGPELERYHRVGPDRFVAEVWVPVVTARA